MSKKKNKSKPYRSVLDGSLTMDKPGTGSGTGDNLTDAKNVSVPEESSLPEVISITEGDGVMISEGHDHGHEPENLTDMSLPEDESISDVPPRNGLNAGSDGYNDFEDDDFSDISDENDEDFNEEYIPTKLDKVIEYVSLLLSVLLLGGSIVFWYTILLYLTSVPFALADAVQMRTLMISCACFPVAAAAVQYILRRPVSAERWLICLCISGALSTLFSIVSQTLFRHIGFTAAELPLILCCAFSGCALPSVICTGIRLLIYKVRGHIETENSRNWETVRSDVLSLTDFRL